MADAWEHLPPHIVVQVYQYLPLPARYHASLVCSLWHDVFTTPQLWHTYCLQFYQQSDKRYLTGLKKYGAYMKKIIIELDQSITSNRENAIAAIQLLTELKKRCFSSFTLKFTAENPLFYSGKEFIDNLSVLFGPPSNDVEVVNPLKYLDLSGLQATLDSNLIDQISANNPHIQHLNIQNGALICKVSPKCCVRLIQRCRKLQAFYAVSCTVNEDVLLAFTEQDREQLTFLSIRYSREEKYLPKISSEVWQAVAKKNPNLLVTQIVDSTCPELSIPNIFDRHIPVQVLRLETFTIIYDEINVAASYYANTLEKLVLNTRPSKELNNALLNLAEKCHKLRSLHVFCVLEKDTIERIWSLHPNMKERNAYTLKWTLDPYPWDVGTDCDSD